MIDFAMRERALAAGLVMALVLGSSSCGQETEPKGSHESSQLSPNADATATKKGSKAPKKSSSKSDGTEGDDDSGSDDQANPGENSEPGGEPGNKDPNAPPSGFAFFQGHLVGLFDNQCSTCHADPRENPPQKGPLSIFSYEKMKLLLSSGRGPLDNALFAKVIGASSHAGGNRCTGGDNASPCADLQTWWKLEYGTPTGEGAQRSMGAILDVSPLGKVYGWAIDPANVTAQVTVRFYLDGPAGTGTMVGETVANIDGDDANQPGAHAFIFDLPAAAKDRKARKIHAYVLIDNNEKALQDQGTNFVAYAPSDTGRAFFNANVAGQLNGCQGCHAVSYEQQFYALLSPAPSKGGTALNNQLISKAGMLNGTSHGGGQRCGGGANAGPCATFQRWWQLEFGTPAP